MDAQQVRDLMETRGWQLIQQRLERIANTKVDELIRPSDAVATAHIRGYIEALKIAIRVPSILIEEGGVDESETASL